MKLFIPELGTELKLTKEWSFKLFMEQRNKSLYVPLLEEETGLKYEEYRFSFFRDNFSFSKRGENWREDKPLNAPILFSSRKLISEIVLKRGTEKEWVEREYSYHYIYSLPKDTVLIVDRIYIRKGNSDYSSVSFKIKGTKKRFWAKLEDVNMIEANENSF